MNARLRRLTDQYKQAEARARAERQMAKLVKSSSRHIDESGCCPYCGGGTCTSRESFTVGHLLQVAVHFGFSCGTRIEEVVESDGVTTDLRLLQRGDWCRYTSKKEKNHE